MKNLLILNLANDTEILSLPYFVAAEREKNPKARITVLVYKDLESIAKIIPNIEIVTIDRVSLNKLSSNSLFSDAMVLNDFLETLRPIMVKKWDSVINYSNDNVSAYLMNLFNTKDAVGTHVTIDGTVKTSNDAATYFNYAYHTTQGEIHFHDVKANLYGLRVPHNAEFVTVDEKANSYVVASLNKIRTKLNLNEVPVAFIGITVMDTEQFSDDDYMQILRGVIDAGNCFPLLLTTGKDSEKKVINYLNHYFNNELISIQCSLDTFSALAMNLNMVISTDMNFTLINDLTQTPCLHMTKSISDKNLSYFSTTATFEYDANTVVGDISTLIRQLKTGMAFEEIAVKTKAYCNVLDKSGSTRKAISASYATACQEYNFRRHFYVNIFVKTNGEQFRISTQLVNQLKDEISTVTRFMLSTLRSLKTAQAVGRPDQLMNNLENLLRLSGELKVLNVPIKLMEGRIENMNEVGRDEIYSTLEANLYTLKENVKLCTHILSGILNQQPRVSQSNDSRA